MKELFIANYFKSVVREYGLKDVQTSPYCLQSNSKLERFHGSLKSGCIRPRLPATKEEADIRIAKIISYYSTVRLHTGIGTISQVDCLAGLSEVIGKESYSKAGSSSEIGSREMSCDETSRLAA